MISSPPLVPTISASLSGSSGRQGPLRSSDGFDIDDLAVRSARESTGNIERVGVIAAIKDHIISVGVEPILSGAAIKPVLPCTTGEIVIAIIAVEDIVR